MTDNDRALTWLLTELKEEGVYAEMAKLFSKDQSFMRALKEYLDNRDDRKEKRLKLNIALALRGAEEGGGVFLDLFYAIHAAKCDYANAYELVTSNSLIYLYECCEWAQRFMKKPPCIFPLNFLDPIKVHTSGARAHIEPNKGPSELWGISVRHPIARIKGDDGVDVKLPTIIHSEFEIDEDLRLSSKLIHTESNTGEGLLLQFEACCEEEFQALQSATPTTGSTVLTCVEFMPSNGDKRILLLHGCFESYSRNDGNDLFFCGTDSTNIFQVKRAWLLSA